MALINVKVAEVKEEAIGVRSFVLAKTGLFKLPKYAPGSHIDVHCGEGIIRQYSLCGDPNDRRHFMIAVKQGAPSRGGSELMHLKVKQGDRLEIGSPRNNFPLDEAAPHVILLAAGIGITPIIAMADRLDQLGKSFELHYFTRSSADTAFEGRLKQGGYSNRVSFYQGLHTQETVSQLQNILSSPQSNAQIYLCGPGPFMDTAEKIALDKWPADAINLERFAANPALAGAPTHQFELTLARSGISLNVAADETILQVLEDNHIDAAFSCEQGVCGTCVTEIIDGEADHRDGFLSAKQKAYNSRMCLCVSRAKGKSLVLDL